MKIELLAPAKNAEIGICAINAGADAVYIGAPQFSARAAAGVSIAEIEQLVKHAHRYYAKVYVALNTLLTDQELPLALSMIQQVYEAGADALIFQDMGLLHAELPPIPLHASTQVNNFSPDRIRFLDQLGIQRIVLARELSLEEIKTIRSQVKAQLEVFIHGALCVSLSGQCYFSERVTGRSANRGECSQPCRMYYDLFDENGNELAYHKHVLSLKDLNQSLSIAELMDSGVTSFKIEGRMKDAAYVTNIIKHYRKIIDAQLELKEGWTKASSGIVRASFAPNPEKTFNRGYTSYFLKGRQRKQSSWDSSSSVGEMLGTVKESDVRRFKIDTQLKLSAGDGLCYFNAKGFIQGLRVNQWNNRWIELFDNEAPPVGTVIYRNHDKAFHDLLERTNCERKIQTRISLVIDEKEIKLHAKDEDGVNGSISLTLSLDDANNGKSPEENIRQQLSKCGDTIFEASEINIDIQRELPPFVPISQINTWRRDLLEELLKQREDKRIRLTQAELSAEVKYPQLAIDSSFNVTNTEAEAFYRDHGVTSIERLTAENQPWLMKTRYCVRNETGNCPGKNRAENAAPWTLKDNNRSYTLIFECSECMMKVIEK